MRQTDGQNQRQGTERTQRWRDIACVTERKKDRETCSE